MSAATASQFDIHDAKANLSRWLADAAVLPA
jgi:hypothetical protein